MRAALFSSVLVSASLLGAHPSGAAEVFDEITLGQLETVLGKSFKVTRRNTDTGVFLLVEGKDNIIGAEARNCGKDKKCEGVEFWAALDRKFSVSQANQYNKTYGYAKVLVMSDGSASVWTQHLTLGGITADNIRYAAAMTMLREDDAENQTVAQVPASSGVVNLSSPIPGDVATLLHREAFDGTQAADFEARAAALEVLRNSNTPPQR